MLHRRIPFARHAGMSLVELLVVITILTIVTAATIPIMAPNVEARRQRETARLITSAFAGAQTRAIASGRPAGIWIERDIGARYASSVLYNCEVPPPYTGDTTDTRFVVERIPSPPNMNDDTTGAAARYNQNTGLNSQYIYFRAILVSGSFSDGMIQPGDRIQFNNQGPSYEIFHGPDPNNDGYINGGFPAPIPAQPNPLPVLPGFIIRMPKRLTDPAPYLDPPINSILNPRHESIEPYEPPDDYQAYNQHYKARYLPWPNARLLPSPPNPREGGRSNPFPFIISRQPQKSLDSPVRLQEGAVIDLRWSGIGDNFGGNSTTPHLTFDPPSAKEWPVNTPVLVMFSPQGDLASISALGSRPEPLESSLHLLVGKRERILDDNYVGTPAWDPMPFPLPTDEEEQLNFQDTENYWVTIQKGNGIATTSQVASVVDPPSTTGFVQPWTYYQFWINSTRRFARTSRIEGGQ